MNGDTLNLVADLLNALDTPVFVAGIEPGTRQKQARVSFVVGFAFGARVAVVAGVAFRMCLQIRVSEFCDDRRTEVRLFNGEVLRAGSEDEN